MDDFRERQVQTMKTLTLAAASIAALSLAPSASAQSSRFNVTSTIFLGGDPLSAVTNSSNTVGLIQADVDGQAFGYARTSVQSSNFDLTLSSAIGALQGSEGNTLGSGRFALDGTQPIIVLWNWSSVSGSGSWSILNSNGVQVAALSFANGAYQSSGGSFGTSNVGNASVSLAAGTYTLRSLFVNSGTATSSVTFTFIPAPGAIVLLGAAGLVGTRRRS